MKLIKPLILSFLSLQVFSFEVEAIYEVPVANEFKRYATFEISQFQINEHTISYTLPETLTGIPLTQLEFESVSLGQYEGVFGSLTCHQESFDTANCFVKYNAKYKKVLSKLSSIILDEFEGTIDDAVLLEARKTVFNSFRSDPIGIIKFKSEFHFKKK